jgi:hypothetical protein
MAADIVVVSEALLITSPAKTCETRFEAKASIKRGDADEEASP